MPPRDVVIQGWDPPSFTSFLDDDCGNPVAYNIKLLNIYHVKYKLGLGFCLRKKEKWCNYTRRASYKEEISVRDFKNNYDLTNKFHTSVLSQKKFHTSVEKNRYIWLSLETLNYTIIKGKKSRGYISLSIFNCLPDGMSCCINKFPFCSLYNFYRKFTGDC